MIKHTDSLGGSTYSFETTHPPQAVPLPSQGKAYPLRHLRCHLSRSERLYPHAASLSLKGRHIILCKGAYLWRKCFSSLKNIIRLYYSKQQNKRFFNENQLPYFAENVIFDLTLLKSVFFVMQNILKSVFFVMQNILKSVKKYHANILKSVKMCGIIYVKSVKNRSMIYMKSVKRRI